MNQCTFLLEQVADCLPTSLSDTIQSAQSSGSHTPAESCENAPPKAGSPTCGCTRETLGCSIHPNTRDEYIQSMRDSLAQILALQGNKLELAKEHEADCIGKSYESLAWYDQEKSSWKTSQQSFLTDWEPFSETWPRSGTMRNGYVFELPMLAQITKETDGGYLQDKYWLTPSTIQITPSQNRREKRTEYRASVGRKDSPGCLEEQVMTQKFWPTPTSHNAKEGAYPSEYLLNTPTLASEVGGKLNASWVEYLMGWPIGCTNLKQ